MLKRSHAVAAVLVLVALGVSHAHAQTQRWELATADTRIGLSVDDNQLLIMRLENATARHNWAERRMAVPFMAKVWIDGQERPVTWTFVNAQEDRDRGCVTLLFSSAEPKLCAEIGLARDRVEARSSIGSISKTSPISRSPYHSRTA